MTFPSKRVTRTRMRNEPQRMRSFVHRSETTNEERRAAEALGAALARRIVEDYGTRDVFEISQRSGVRILYQRWPLVTVGECEPRTATIRINVAALEGMFGAGQQLSPQALARMIIAHELGHLFDADLMATTRRARAGRSAGEAVAHGFAASLLKLPPAELKVVVDDLPLACARVFGRRKNSILEAPVEIPNLRSPIRL